MLAIIDDSIFDLHNSINTYDHYERKERVQVIEKVLRENFGDNEGVIWIKPRPILFRELVSVHDKFYIWHVLSRIRNNTETSTNFILDDRDLPVTLHSLQSIFSAAGAVIQAAQLVLDETNNIERVFCNIRPPGHHARKGKGAGFCFFNNLWLGVHYVLENTDHKIAILDWDVHHGDGTESFIFKLNEEQSNRILFINTQQAYKSIWPQTGKPGIKGSHKNIVRYNFGDGDDVEVMSVFESDILPRLREYNPCIIFISCGFDAHILDPLGDLNFSSELYGWMTRKVREVCPRIVSALEGGYNLTALRESSVFHVRELL